MCGCALALLLLQNDAARFLGVEGPTATGASLSPNSITVNGRLLLRRPVPFAAAYLIYPPPSCHEAPIFRLGKSARLGAEQAERREQQEEGGEENEVGRRNFSRRQRHRQFNDRVSRHKIWRSRPCRCRHSKNQSIAQDSERNFPANLDPARLSRPSPPLGSYFNVIAPLHSPSSSNFCNDESNFTKTSNIPR